jgi:hypothetical protein
MIIHGKSRAVASIVAVALGLALAAPAAAQPAEKPAATKPAARAAPKAPAAPAAPAAAKPGDAKGLFASGEKKFKASDYAGALADFQASNEAKESPEAERYIAMAQDNLQHYAEAVAAYEKFIGDNPPKMKDQVEEAKKRVEAIKAMPGKVHVETTPPGASIVIDTSQSPYDKVTPTDVELAPGAHSLLIGAEGYENKTEQVSVTYAGKSDLKVELVKKEPPPPPPPVVAETPAPAPTPPPPPPEPRSKVPAYVTGAVAIVAAGVGTVFGINALNQSSDFNKNPTTKKADDGENNALVADMMFGIAITFGVTSAVLFLSNDAPTTAQAAEPKTAAKAEPKKKRSVTVIPAPYVTPTGGGASALIRF